MIPSGPRCCVSTSTTSTTTPMAANPAHHVIGPGRRALNIRCFGKARLGQLARAARLDSLEYHWHDRYQYDGDHNQGEVLTNERNVAEKVSGKGEECRPDDA